MTDNLEDIKSKWQSIKVDNESLRRANERLSDELRRRPVESLQDRLAGRIFRNCILAIVLPLLAPVLYFTLKMPMWLTIFYAAFGLMMCGLQTFLYEYIKREQLTLMAVVDAIERAVHFKLYQLRIRLVGMIVGMTLVTGIFVYLVDADDLVALYGAIVGLVVGLAVGCYKFYTDLAISKKIIKSLEEIEKESEE